MKLLSVLALYIFAALTEICGCYAIWKIAHETRTFTLFCIAFTALTLFAYLLTLVPGDTAGKTYAAYGAVYIIVAFILATVGEHAVFSLTECFAVACIIFGAALLTIAKMRN